MKENNIEYSISIRITFPEVIREAIKREKQRFVSEYGSKYKSEPHITVYLTKYTLDRYTTDGFSKLIQDLRGLSLKQFEISLLSPKVIVEEDRHRNLYVLDVSNKEQIQEVSDKVYKVASQYRSTLMGEDEKRSKELEPHITLGEIDFDKPQADISDAKKNLQQIVGEKVTVSNLVIFFYIKEPGEEKSKLLEEIIIPINQ